MPSQPEQLLPYEPPHVLAGRARARSKVEPPEFSELLVDNFASGASSGAKVQATASSAVKWCLKKGGHVDADDMVSKIANLGTEGRHKANIERDFHTLLRSFSRRLGAKLSTVRARMYNHKTASIEWQSVPVLFPDDLATALYKRGENVFQHCMMGKVDAAKYLGHCSRNDSWFSTHPMKHYPRLDRLIPFSLYGDDVQCYKNSEIGTVSIIGWTSDFAFNNKSLTRYFPICVYSEHCSTEYTHEDIMVAVTERIRSMVDPEEIQEWSSTGWAFIFSNVQGDLKWIRDQYGIFNFSANDCCSLCGAVKDHDDPSMTIADFRPTASHVGSSPDLGRFSASPSVVFTSLGIGPDRVVHDSMHGQLLGTGKVSNGSGIVYLAESGFWNPFQTSGTYPDALQYSLQLAHKDFLAWKKKNWSQCFTTTLYMRKVV